MSRVDGPLPSFITASEESVNLLASRHVVRPLGGIVQPFRQKAVLHAFPFHCNSSIIFRMVRSRLRAWKLVLLALVLAPLIALLALGLWPVSADFAGDEGTAGVDARA